MIAGVAEKEFITGRPATGVWVAAGVVFLVVLLGTVTGAFEFAAGVVLAEGVQAKHRHKIAMETSTDRVVLFNIFS